MFDDTAGHYRFPTTHWSLIGRATGDVGDAAHRAALNELLKRYLPALHAHLVVQKRINASEADDLVQGFVTDKVLERNLVGTADSARGRFRSLLATALDNYVRNEWQRRGAQKRRPDRATSLDDPQRHSLAAVGDQTERALDVEWGREVLSETLRRMKAECEVTDHVTRWNVFQARVLAPVLDDAPTVGYEEIVAEFGFASPTQASNALMTAKRAFARILREVIAEYARDPEEVEEEIRELRVALAGSSSAREGHE